MENSLFITRVAVLSDGDTVMITHIDGDGAINEKFNSRINAVVMLSEWIEEFIDDDFNWDVEGIKNKIVADIKLFAKESGYSSARDFLTDIYAGVVLTDG